MAKLRQKQLTNHSVLYTAAVSYTYEFESRVPHSTTSGILNDDVINSTTIDHISP